MTRRAAMLALLLAGSLLLPAGARAPPPALLILGPTDGAIVGGGDPVVIIFSLTDFTLVQPGRIGQVPGPTEGHVSVFVDGALDRILIRVEPVVLPLPSGPHTIRLELTESDGSPIVPEVSATVRVTATRGPASGIPGIAITYPPYDLSTGHDVYVSVAVTNFTLVAPEGRPNAPNEGHLVVLLNEKYHGELATHEPAFLVDLPDGHSTITVRLVNNDGTALSPDASTSTRVYIKGANPLLSEVISGGIVVLLVALLAVATRRGRAGVGPRGEDRDAEHRPD